MLSLEHALAHLQDPEVMRDASKKQQIEQFLEAVKSDPAALPVAQKYISEPSQPVQTWFACQLLQTWLRPTRWATLDASQRDLVRSLILQPLLQQQQDGYISRQLAALWVELGVVLDWPESNAHFLTQIETVAASAPVGWEMLAGVWELVYASGRRARVVHARRLQLKRALLAGRHALLPFELLEAQLSAVPRSTALVVAALGAVQSVIGLLEPQPGSAPSVALIDRLVHEAAAPLRHQQQQQAAQGPSPFELEVPLRSLQLLHELLSRRLLPGDWQPVLRDLAQRLIGMLELAASLPAPSVASLPERWTWQLLQLLRALVQHLGRVIEPANAAPFLALLSHFLLRQQDGDNWLAAIEVLEALGEQLGGQAVLGSRYRTALEGILVPLLQRCVLTPTPTDDDDDDDEAAERDEAQRTALHCVVQLADLVPRAALSVLATELCGRCESLVAADAAALSREPRSAAAAVDALTGVVRVLAPLVHHLQDPPQPDAASSMLARLVALLHRPRGSRPVDASAEA
eukprot:TRINITY_DN3237_c1_g1_i2.p1 TRINITY_DN3237_c1_g1~~TRINITY_DN3237_c1_g1_i2.p1  ORF type:complete len:519 (+),score=171.52 TRINITY_DN3237_c1_g1_i2:167-1723(+)